MEPYSKRFKKLKSEDRWDTSCKTEAVTGGSL